ncbi:GAF domain-containing protein [Streptomyces tanashiensis]
MDKGAGAADTDDGTETPRLPMLLEAVLSVGTDLELRTTLQHIVDSATELTGARFGALGVVDPERHRLTDLFTSGMTDAERQRIGRLPDGRTGLIGALIQDPQPLRLDDLTADPRSSGAPRGPPGDARLPRRPDPGPHPGLRQSVPHREARGRLHRGGPRPAPGPLLPGRDRHRQRPSVRDQPAAGALDRGRGRRDHGPATGATAENALTTVAEQARILADASAGVVLQPTEEGGMEIVAASTTDDPGDLVGTAIAPGSPVLVQLLGGEPVFVEDSATDPRMTTHVRSRFGPSMMLPLQSGGKLIGTLPLGGTIPTTGAGAAHNARAECTA